MNSETIKIFFKSVILFSIITTNLFARMDNRLMDPSVSGKKIIDIGVKNINTPIAEEVQKEIVKINAQLRQIEDYLDLTKRDKKYMDCYVDDLGNDTCPKNMVTCSGSVKYSRGFSIKHLVYETKRAIKHGSASIKVKDFKWTENGAIKGYREKNYHFSLTKQEAAYPGKPLVIFFNTQNPEFKLKIRDPETDKILAEYHLKISSKRFNFYFFELTIYPGKSFSEFNARYFSYKVGKNPYKLKDKAKYTDGKDLFTVKMPNGLKKFESPIIFDGYMNNGGCGIKEREDTFHIRVNYSDSFEYFCDSPWVQNPDNPNECILNYTWYEYVCPNEERWMKFINRGEIPPFKKEDIQNANGLSWEGPLVSTGGDCGGSCGSNGCSCNSETPPANNCKRIDYICPVDADKVCARVPVGGTLVEDLPNKDRVEIPDDCSTVFPGSEYDPATGKCVLFNNEEICPPGYSLGAVDGNMNQCQMLVTDDQCQDGLSYKPDRNKCENYSINTGEINVNTKWWFCNTCDDDYSVIKNFVTKPLLAAGATHVDIKFWVKRKICGKKGYSYGWWDEEDQGLPMIEIKHNSKVPVYAYINGGSKIKIEPGETFYIFRKGFLTASCDERSAGGKPWMYLSTKAECSDKVFVPATDTYPAHYACKLSNITCPSGYTKKHDGTGYICVKGSSSMPVCPHGGNFGNVSDTKDKCYIGSKCVNGVIDGEGRCVVDPKIGPTFEFDTGHVERYSRTLRSPKICPGQDRYHPAPYSYVIIESVEDHGFTYAVKPYMTDDRKAWDDHYRVEGLSLSESAFLLSDGNWYVYRNPPAPTSRGCGFSTKYFKYLPDGMLEVLEWASEHCYPRDKHLPTGHCVKKAKFHSKNGLYLVAISDVETVARNQFAQYACTRDNAFDEKFKIYNSRDGNEKFTIVSRKGIKNNPGVIDVEHLTTYNAGVDGYRAEYDPKREVCVMDAPKTCKKDGYIYIESLGKCGSPAMCNGYFNEKTGKCELPPIVNCPNGGQYDKTSFKCKSSPFCPNFGQLDEDSGYCMYDFGCQNGFIYDDSRKVCTKVPWIEEQMKCPESDLKTWDDGKTCSGWINFGKWTIVDPIGTANWYVYGTYARQTNTSYPNYLLSYGDFEDGLFMLKFHPYTDRQYRNTKTNRAGHYIGFIFGYKNDSDFYLIDWNAKRLREGFPGEASGEIRLVHVTIPSSSWKNSLWSSPGRVIWSSPIDPWKFNRDTIIGAHIFKGEDQKWRLSIVTGKAGVDLHLDPVVTIPITSSYGFPNNLPPKGKIGIFNAFVDSAEFMLNVYRTSTTCPVGYELYTSDSESENPKCIKVIPGAKIDRASKGYLAPPYCPRGVYDKDKDICLAVPQCME